MQKAHYIAQNTQEEYFEVLISSRDGINQNVSDIALLGQRISPLLKKRQALHISMQTMAARFHTAA